MFQACQADRHTTAASACSCQSAARLDCDAADCIAAPGVVTVLQLTPCTTARLDSARTSHKPLRMATVQQWQAEGH